ncbi:MAG TPA: D-sedoheptulose 7-phosphate isomerase [Bacteroidales bacterium]|nr:D-sedoheptulose 7-phosphate isomerase [Bacteroidales bacterium]HPS18293.1 D-sedoheptulose 7-phosphate isomerase [Bacteroidales bacterium]
MISKAIQNSIALKEKILHNKELLRTVQIAADEIIVAFKNGNKVLFCGNGGSAADAQHLAAEFSGRFYYDREPLPSEALHVNTSFLTAVGNDYSFAKVYERAVKAQGKKGDILVGISTSGNSENIVNAMKAATELGMRTIGFTGETGGKMKNHSCYLINVPSTDTPRIQEAHIMLGHIICEIVEKTLFPK